MNLKKITTAILIFSVSVLLFNTTADAKRKKKIKHWKVNMHFYIGVPKSAAVEKWIHDEIAIAEQLFSSKPALKINPTFIYKQKAGGQNLASLSFGSSKRYHKYMDKYFDHYAKSRTSGHFTVLVTGALKINGYNKGGKAYFPHSVIPFSRKHGVTIVTFNRSVLAHELGHSFGLKHTWEHYLTARCNKDYKKKEGSTRKDGRVNLMDYGRGNLVVYLNKCQRHRAAKKRRNWMTRKGRIKYKKMRGMR